MYIGPLAVRIRGYRRVGDPVFVVDDWMHEWNLITTIANQTL